MIYDISPPITADMPIWPGDTPPTRELLARLEAGAGVTLSTWHTTVHAGAHADAPLHVIRGGSSIDACPLDAFIGPAEVIRVAAKPASSVRPDDLPGPIRTPRVLFATGTWSPRGAFQRDFAGLSVELADHLRAAGVCLVGVDTPSVDTFADESLPVHRRLLGNGIAVLEGLDLKEVPAGRYELIALPLRLEGFEASPVRALLRPM